MAGLTIGKFAAAEGVSVETVRFYQRQGLLALPARAGGAGFREYSEADRWRLAFIRRARRLGFTLAEVRDLLGPAEARSTGEIVAAAEAKLAAVGLRIRELTEVECRLRRLMQVCEHGDSDACAALQPGEACSSALSSHPAGPRFVGLPAAPARAASRGGRLASPLTARRDAHRR